MLVVIKQEKKIIKSILFMKEIMIIKYVGKYLIKMWKIQRENQKFM